MIILLLVFCCCCCCCCCYCCCCCCCCCCRCCCCFYCRCCRCRCRCCRCFCRCRCRCCRCCAVVYFCRTSVVHPLLYASFTRFLADEIYSEGGRSDIFQNTIKTENFGRLIFGQKCGLSPLYRSLRK